MSSVPPPTENLPIFNPANFPGTSPIGGGGGGGGGAPSLNFPTAQGTETFPNGIVFGDGTYTNSATNYDSLNITGVYPDSGIDNPVNTGAIASAFGSITPSTTVSTGFRADQYVNISIPNKKDGTQWNPSNVVNDPNSCWLRITQRTWEGDSYTGETTCTLQIFPNRWTNSSSLNPADYNINNKINNNANYNYVDPTYAPYGRQYYTYDQNFTGTAGENAGLTNQSYYLLILFYVQNVATNPNQRWSWTCEVLDSTYLQDQGFALLVKAENLTQPT